MEVGMSLNSMVRVPLSNSRTLEESHIRHSLFSTRKTTSRKMYGQKERRVMVVEAKGKKGMVARQYQRSPPPPLPKIEDDGNPKFLIFIRMANVYLWYPLNLITGGTTAKIMVAAKDNFLGKYIYKDTLARNIAAVIYKELRQHKFSSMTILQRWMLKCDISDILFLTELEFWNRGPLQSSRSVKLKLGSALEDEKEIQKMAQKQFRPLRTATEFRYGYKLVENNNIRAALNTTDVIELPTQGELKTVLDKVKDFFGDAKESFGKLTSLNAATESAEEDTKEKSKEKSTVKS